MSGLLSDREIEVRVARGELIAESSFNDQSVQPASYDLTIAATGLITPAGEVVEPTAGAHRGSVVLHGGDTALFSSQERFRMPDDVAGNITIRNRLAAQGLTLLSGMLIDPGFGRTAPDGSDHGCCIYLHVANIAREPIALRPGEDTVARVQFLRVDGEVSDKRKPVEPSRWDDQKQASLGFLTEMRELKDDVERHETRSEVIVTFGFWVLAVALIGASFSAILSIVTNSTLQKHLRNAWPHSSSDKILWSCLILGVAIVAYALVIGARELIRGWSTRRLTGGRRRSDGRT